MPGTARFYELKVSTANPKLAALRAGSFQLSADGH